MKRKVIYFWKKAGARGSDWEKKRLNKGKDKSTDCWLKIKNNNKQKTTKSFFTERSDTVKVLCYHWFVVKKFITTFSGSVLFFPFCTYIQVRNYLIVRH